jgi:hydrogenase small subunit
MQISRRGFLKYCIGSAAALGLPLTVVGKLEEALAATTDGLPKVVWLAGANCTGCTVSLANRISSEGPTDLVDLLTGYIDLAYHPNLMGAAGDLAVQRLRDTTAGSFILAVEGGIPTAFGGHTCMLWTEDGVDVTAQEAVRDLASKAAAVLSIGTCASHGGIPGANPNPTGIVSVSELTGLQTINIPGCPTHPDWIVWTVANLLAGEVPALDSQGRPQALYQGIIHSSCPYRNAHEAEQFGNAGSCLEELGCKGKITRADCPSRKWNGGVNWCIGAGSICLGCTESGFPDSFSPFYVEQESETPDGGGSDGSDSGSDSGSDDDSSTGGDTGTGDTGTGDDSGSGDTGTGDDSGSGGGTTVSLQIDRADWQRKGRTLVVEGQTAPDTVVMVASAATGTLFGVVSADSDGRWRLNQSKVSKAPCRIRVEAGDQARERDVRGAPRKCT